MRQSIPLHADVAQGRQTLQTGALQVPARHAAAGAPAHLPHTLERHVPQYIRAGLLHVHWRCASSVPCMTIISPSLLHQKQGGHALLVMSPWIIRKAPEPGSCAQKRTIGCLYVAAVSLADRFACQTLGRACRACLCVLLSCSAVPLITRVRQDMDIQRRQQIRGCQRACSRARRAAGQPRS